MDFDIRPQTVLLTRAGSRAYGINTPESDLDIKGIAFAPKNYYYGCMFNFEQAVGKEHIEKFLDLLSPEEIKNGFEGTIYEIKKYIKLAVVCNPSILDALYTRDQDVLFSTKIGELLRANRDIFLSAKAYWSYSKYAISQLRKIQSHRSWMLNPPTKEPARADFGLAEAYPKAKFDAAFDAIKKKVDGWEIDMRGLEEPDRIYLQSQIEDHLTEIGVVSDEKWKYAGRAIGFGDDFLHILELERKFRSAQKEWKSFQEWKLKRNPERAALEMKYGYDCKFAVHLCRLMRQCRELMETGKVRVWRGGIDAEELLAIRNGAWTYEQVLEYATKEDAALKKLHDTGNHCLRKVPDVKAVDALCRRIFEEYLSPSMVRRLLNRVHRSIV